jgi:chromosome partitioning protein
MAKIISVATHKGGTGKTVTAMALSAALARAGKRSLLVDLDPQGHCTLGLGVEVGDTEPTLRDLFAEPPMSIARIIHQTSIPELAIVPSNIRLARIAQALYMRPKREDLLRRALEPVRNHYDFMIIDCPPTLGVLTETGIAAADFIVVPCQMEARASDGLVDLLEVISLIKGEGFEHWRILLTRMDSRKSTTNQAVMASLMPWQGKIFEATIPQSEPLNQAQIERTDIYSFDSKSRGAVAYEAFMHEILKLC